MKTYRELYFRGSREQLKKFIDEMKKCVVVNWRMEIQSERWNREGRIKCW